MLEEMAYPRTQSPSERCTSVMSLTLIPDAPMSSLRCDLSVDHIPSHALMHDDLVLLAWGMNDIGEGTILGGVLWPLFRDTLP